MQYLDAISKKKKKTTRMISVHFRQTIHITVIQVYAPTSNAKVAEDEWFYEDVAGLGEGKTLRRRPCEPVGPGKAQ